MRGEMQISGEDELRRAHGDQPITWAYATLACAKGKGATCMDALVPLGARMHRKRPMPAASGLRASRSGLRSHKPWYRQFALFGVVEPAALPGARAASAASVRPEARSASDVHGRTSAAAATDGERRPASPVSPCGRGRPVGDSRGIFLSPRVVLDFCARRC
jgi:hypothetical protein